MKQREILNADKWDKVPKITLLTKDSVRIFWTKHHKFSVHAAMFLSICCIKNEALPSSGRRKEARGRQPGHPSACLSSACTSSGHISDWGLIDTGHYNPHNIPRSDFTIKIPTNYLWFLFDFVPSPFFITHLKIPIRKRRGVATKFCRHGTFTLR